MFLFQVYSICKQCGIPYCARIKVLVLLKAGLKMAAAETCRHALNKSCSYSLLWNIVVYRRK